MDLEEVALNAAASEPRRQQAVSHYDALLGQTDIRHFAEDLQQELRDRAVLFGERLVCPFLRPSFITREQFVLLDRAVSGVVGAMLALVPTIMASEEIKGFLGLTEGERRLMDIDPGYPEISVSSRLDSFLSGGTCRFVEYNAECPAGIGYGDIMLETFLDSSVMRRFVQSHPVSAPFCSERLLQALLESYRNWGGSDEPVLAVIDYDGLPTRHEFGILQRFFQSRGLRTLVADPRKLEYRGGFLRHEGQPIHLVYRRLLTNEYLERDQECRPVFQACRDRRVCLVNSFRSKLLHKKAIFALLTDPCYRSLLSTSQQQAVRAHVPWTRRVLDCRTTGPDDNPVGLLEFIRRNRDDLVLKPNDLYGGEGIRVGWERTDQEWDEDIQQALRGDILVQQRVAIVRESYPVWDGHQVTWGEYTVDMDPFVFAGRAEGMMTRLASSSLCNVTAGGGVVPCFILD